MLLLGEIQDIAASIRGIQHSGAAIRGNTV